VLTPNLPRGNVPDVPDAPPASDAPPAQRPDSGA